MVIQRRKLTSVLEISGSVLGIFYALLIASNTGLELMGFFLLLLSACLFAGWAIVDRRWAFLLLQCCFMATALLGLISWA